MNILEAIILGIIQGCTEFLPISSSGHLILASKLLGVQSSLTFDLIAHLGTLLAIIIVYYKDIFSVIRHPLSKFSKLLLVATIPTIILVVIFESVFRSSFDGKYLTYCFILSGILLMAAGLKTKSPKKQIGYFDALCIGVAQGFAAFPGISRSGATISTATLLGNEKTQSAKFSFLLSIPIILGSSLVEIIKNTQNLISISFFPLFFGFIFSFLSGFLTIKLMIKILNKHSLDGFAIYLFALATFMLINDFALHLF